MGSEPYPPDDTAQWPSPFRDPSAFGVGFQWAWDSTSMGWLKECPRKYFYHMVCGYIGRGEAVHLEYGILYHKALENFERYRFEGMDHDDAVKRVVHDTLVATWRDGKPWRGSIDLPPDDKASLKNRENLIRTIVWYLYKFKDDPAKTRMHPITGLPMVELHFQFEIEDGYTLCGYLDRVVEFQEVPFAMDRKTTTTTLSSYYFEQYDPDNQMSFYSFASRVAFKTPVKGVIVDAAQIAVGFSRFGRSFVTKTDEQLDEWHKDLKVYLKQAKQYVEDQYWPQNDKSCHKYGGCIFIGICTKSPSVREKFLQSAFEVRSWNPLIPR